MEKRLFFTLFFMIACFFTTSAQESFETDVLKTSDGDLKITCIGHGTLMFTYKNAVIHVDPVGRYADYTTLPKADLILVTHEHGDHLDNKVLDILRNDKTKLIITEIIGQQISDGIVMKNGEAKTVDGIRVEAVPAYNIIHKRDNGNPYHPKGNGNGYIMTFGDKRVYIAGDTENTPEMKKLKDIDVAFLPMNLPYTMDPEMVADAAKAFMPKILYPYHFGRTDTQKLVDLLKDVRGIEVRIRKLN